VASKHDEEVSWRDFLALRRRRDGFQMFLPNKETGVVEKSGWSKKSEKLSL
jgi:hypothetical protein